MTAITVLVLMRDCDATALCNLRICLRSTLSQQYDDFEVVVALFPEAAKMARPLLEQMELGVMNLRHIEVPSNSRFIQNEQMAITLGVRTARCEWILLTESDCRPASDLWLATMADKMHDNIDAVAGYANYDNDFTGLRCTWRRGVQNMATLRFAASQKKRRYIYHADSCNIAFRRSCFLNTCGFRDLLDINSGSIVLWINRLTNVDATMSSEARVLQQMSDEHRWRDPDAMLWRTLRPQLTHKRAYRLSQLPATFIPLLLLPLFPFFVAFIARATNRRLAAFGSPLQALQAYRLTFRNFFAAL